MLRNLILDWAGTLVEEAEPIFRHSGQPELLLEEFRERLPDLDRVALLPHALGFLRFCRASARQLFLVSDESEAQVATQSARLGLAEFFSEMHAGVTDQSARILEILHRQNLDARETAFISARPRQCGITSIVTLNGRRLSMKLLRAQPDVVVRDLRELQKLLENVSPNDEILIEDLELFARLGVPEAERGQAQRLTISLRLELPHGFHTLDDGLARTVDYAAVCAALRKFVQTREDRLLETLADAMAEHLLARFGLARVTLELRKFVLPETKYVAAKVTRAVAPLA